MFVYRRRYSQFPLTSIEPPEGTKKKHEAVVMSPFMLFFPLSFLNNCLSLIQVIKARIRDIGFWKCTLLVDITRSLKLLLCTCNQLLRPINHSKLRQ